MAFAGGRSRLNRTIEEVKTGAVVAAV